MAYNLKSEEEVKLYLKNLYTEYSFGCYGEKNSESCHLLGEFYESVKRDFTKSAEIYKNNCDNFDHGRSCTKFARQSVVGEGCEKNMKTAFQYMKKGCEFNDGVGCLYAGLMTASKDDIGVPDKKASVREGVKMLAKGCDELNETKACHFLASIYLKGLKDIFEKDLRKAHKYSLKSCESGNPFACANVAQMYERGEGAEKNQELADTYRKRVTEIENEMKNNQVYQFQQGINT